MKDMNLSDFTHGDERYHNNLFVGHNGLACYGKAVNLQAAGNLFFKDVAIQLEEKENGFWIRITELPASESAQTRSIVTTELLGKAKVSDSPFDNPDGMAYRLDTDYDGKKRNANPSPGPFRTQGGEDIHLKVWPKK